VLSQSGPCLLALEPLRTSLGVEFNPNQAELVLEATENSRPIALYARPDGSVTNWRRRVFTRFLYLAKITLCSKLLV